MNAKADLRIEARRHRAALCLAQPDFAQVIAGFADALTADPADVIASYCARGDEADPAKLADALRGRGHRIALPCIEGDAMPLAFRLHRGGMPLQQNLYGVWEPTAEAPVLTPDWVLVPLLAFDREGFRLGYGGGYYDRTLATLRSQRAVVAAGVGYVGQEVERLPREPHDEPLDLIVTETGIRRVPQRSGVWNP